MIDPVLAVIPARLGASRLPRKPLRTLAGKPLIEWVWRRATETGLFSRIVVATDSDEIVAAAEGFGAQAVLTSAAHPSGTDRVAEVVSRDAFEEFDTVVNVQGDEPFLTRAHLAGAIEMVVSGRWQIATAAAPLTDVAEYRNPAVVKVVRASDGGALYFSRAPIPAVRDGDPAARILHGDAFFRHLGVYVYRRAALLQWVGLPLAELEQIERLEQLRPLSAGIPIGVDVVAGDLGTLGVDTPADAARAEELLLERSQN